MDIEDEKPVPRIFTIKSVNTYGSSEIDSFDDDGSELRLSSKSFITSFVIVLCFCKLDSKLLAQNFESAQHWNCSTL